MSAQDASQSERTFSSTELAERTLHRRAVEAAIWGMPLVNVDAMRQPYFKAGASFQNSRFDPEF